MSFLKRRLLDRYDGKLLRSLDPFYKVIPYIMPTRLSAQVFFEETFEFEEIDKYIKAKREAGLKNFGFFHVLIAVIVRVLSQHPKLNRFVSGHKIYARNEILVSFVVKRSFRNNSSETTVKLTFDPQDTIYDIYSKVNHEVNSNKDENLHNSVDKTAKFIMLCPGFLIKFGIFLIKALDGRGLLPKALNKLSPLHTSVFVTNVASLGILPIYHHLYEIGTASIFISLGSRQKSAVSHDRSIPLKIAADERIADGFAFASAFKLFRNLLKNPERLDFKPEKVILDVD